jgi:hypothetical protein
MAGKILSVVFWLVAASLLGYALSAGGWALAVPAAVVVALLVFAADISRHRDAVSFDRGLLRTLLHVLSAVTVAASLLYYLALVLFDSGS